MDLPPGHEHLRPDGGTGEVLDPPPLDAMDDAALTPEALAENAPGLETVVQLLNRPALARIYVYICYRGPVTPPAIMDALALSKSTTYEYVDTLTELGLVERDDSTRPQRLTAEPLIILEQYASIIVTPTVLHAIALQEVDEDIAYFVERHGVGKLVAALRGAGLHFAGKTTQRMVATDIDVRDTETMMIIYALRPALALGREHDPYFAYLFPDVHDQLDLPEPDGEDGDSEQSPATSTDE
jgi:IclR helix-turn-helix domain.